MTLGTHSARRALRSFLTLLAAAVLVALDAGTAQAKTIGEVLAEFREAQNGLLEGYRLFQSGDAPAASLALQNAQSILDTVKDDLVDPSVADLLAKKLAKALKKTGVFEERIVGAQAYVDGGVAKASVLLRKVRSTWRYGQRVANLVGKPMLANRDAGSAGFQKAGQRVTFRFAIPEGCDDPPQVTVQNGGLANAIDVGTVIVDEARGTVSFLMGYEAGGGRVTVSACGREETVLVYNKGPKIPAGLPEGFPTNLAPGNYQMTYSVNSGPTVNAGTVRLTNLKSFAKQVQGIVGGVVSGIQLPGECTKGLGWTAAADNSFGYVFTVTCTVADVVVSSSGVFSITNI